MDQTKKILIEAYLKESLENLEISAGRIILDSEHEVTKAGIEEIDKARKAATEFFNAKFQQVKELLCEKYINKIKKLEENTNNGIELIGYISAILESNNISFGPLNYIFISVWIVKHGINKLCRESISDQ